MKNFDDWKYKTMRIPSLHCNECPEYCFGSVCFRRINDNMGFCTKFEKIVIIDSAGLHFAEDE